MTGGRSQGKTNWPPLFDRNLQSPQSRYLSRMPELPYLRREIYDCVRKDALKDSSVHKIAWPSLFSTRSTDVLNVFSSACSRPAASGGPGTTMARDPSKRHSQLRRRHSFFIPPQKAAALVGSFFLPNFLFRSLFLLDPYNLRC